MAKKNPGTIKPADRHLDVPAEANRDKHINILALENNDVDPGTERPVTASHKTKRSLADKIFIQTPEKKRSTRKRKGRKVHPTAAAPRRKLSLNPRNLPTENASMAANMEKPGNSGIAIKKDGKKR